MDRFTFIIFGVGALVVMILVAGIIYTLGRTVFNVIPVTKAVVPVISYNEYLATSLPINKTPAKNIIDYSFN